MKGGEKVAATDDQLAEAALGPSQQQGDDEPYSDLGEEPLPAAEPAAAPKQPNPAALVPIISVGMFK
jgi:hypothetical protein